MFSQIQLNLSTLKIIVSKVNVKNIQNYRNQPTNWKKSYE